MAELGQHTFSKMNISAEFAGPPLLYHYTDAHGLIGIVQDRSMWASRATYLNDGKELAHAYDIALRQLHKVKTQSSGLEAFRRYLETTTIAPYIFVASFSAQADQLSQWRAYGRGGNAYSIGFNSIILSSAAQRVGWRLAPCLYQMEEQQRLVLGVLDNFADLFAAGQIVDANDPDPDSVYLRYCHGALLQLSPLLKHSSFSEEQEWRLVSPITEHEVFHRPGAWSLIPYKRFPLPCSQAGGVAIAELIVGPGRAGPSEAGAAVQSVVSLFRSCGIVDGWTARPSQVPFRG